MSRSRTAHIALVAGALALAACETETEAPAASSPAAATPAPTPTPTKTDGRLATVISHERRENDAARDQYRHPAETLEFFRLSPDQTVIEYAPGGGWYTRILAPYLADYGKYIAVGFAPDDVESLDQEFRTRLRRSARTFSQEQSRDLGISPDKMPFHFANAIPDQLNGTVDTVLVIRMMHNLMRWDIAEAEIAALRETLKPGGMLGVVQHRAKPDAPDDYADGNAGYLKQEDVIAFFKENGFELVDTSEINANPRDTADYEDGVWTLPPSYSLGDTDRRRYTDIGESDRMTLLFRKVEPSETD